MYEHISELKNNFILIEGSLELYGNPPKQISRKLQSSLEFITPSVDYIELTDGWQEGDQIVIIPDFLSD